MNYAEFTGNLRITEYFRKAVKRRRMGHSYLFTGPEGLGKFTLARLVCKHLLCVNPQDDGPCELCPSCHKFDSGNHSDFHFFAAEGLYFKIDQVRQVIHQASLKPVESQWKTFVLENSDYMRDEAANALLKVLEEPPGETVFFLLSLSPEALLPTIRSRCQHFAFQPLTEQEIENHLMQQKGLDAERAAESARFSRGSLGRALTLNTEKFRELRERVMGVLEAALLPKTYFVLLDEIKSFIVDRAEMGDRFLLLEELIRDLMLLKSGYENSVVHADLKPRLVKLAAKISDRQLQDFYIAFMETREAVLKINANISLSLQGLLLPLRAAEKS